MKKLLTLTFLLINCSILASCQDDEVIAPSLEEEITDLVGQGYIKGDFGDQALIFNYEPLTEGPFPVNSYNPNFNGGGLHLLMAGEASLNLGVVGLDLNVIKENLPFTINKAKALLNNKYPLYAHMELYDCRFNVPVMYGPEDNFNYTMHTYMDQDNFILTITKLKGDVMEGTFSGIMRTATGLKKPVKNGEFKMKIKFLPKE